MKVAELMSVAVHTCGADDTLEDVARQMWNHDCGFMVVVDDEGALVGVLTDRDLCMAAYRQGKLLHAIPVREAMTREVHAISADATLPHALHLLANHELRRLPVVDPRRRVVGVVSLTDLAREAERGYSRGQHNVARREITRVLAGVRAPEGTFFDTPSRHPGT